jgi:hypothetical protein
MVGIVILLLGEMIEIAVPKSLEWVTRQVFIGMF